MGVYEVERVVAKRVKRAEAEYFIHWKNYFPSENTWEPAEHLPEDIIAAFENRSVDPLRVDECRERLALLFEKGLKSPTACNETITMRHDVLRALFSGLPSDLVRPTAREPVPRNRRGADNSRPWFLPEEMFNSDSRRMSRRHSSQLKAVSWQVSYLLR